MMTTSDKHWVEDLFPPKFGYTLDEILKEGKVSDSGEDPGDQTESVFAKVACRVSPLDVTAIKNVYERVWLMTYLEDEERKKREEEESDSETVALQSFQRTSTPLGGRSPSHLSKSKRRVKNAETSTSDINEKAPLDIHDPCIWSSKEIEVLRAVFKTAKEQNTRLQAQLKETQLQYDKLQEKHKKLSSEHSARARKLKEATKANERMDILCKNLQQQVLESTRQIDMLRKHVEELKVDRAGLLKQTHELRVASDHERLDRKKAELQLQQQTAEAVREERVREENLKLMHSEDIHFLQRTIDELTDELTQERKDHERTKRGLKHLQTHFSSLPLEGDRVPDGVVRHDQLKDFTC